MSEVMEPHQGQAVLLEDEPEMMGHKVGVDSRDGIPKQLEAYNTVPKNIKSANQKRLGINTPMCSYKVYYGNAFELPYLIVAQ